MYFGKKKLRLRKEVKQYAHIAAAIIAIAALNLALASAAKQSVLAQTKSVATDNTNEALETEKIKEMLASGSGLNAAIVTRLDDGKVVGYKELSTETTDAEKAETVIKDAVVETAKLSAEKTTATAAASVTSAPVKQVVAAPTYTAPVAQAPAYEEPVYTEPAPEYTEVYEAPAETYVPEETYVYDGSNYDGAVLNPTMGVVYGPSGKETYYNLNMSGVVNIMRGMGNTDQYWVREDGAKMLGDYVIVAANLDTHPRGSLVETSMGTGIVCDTGGFAAQDPNQIDIATTW